MNNEDRSELNNLLLDSQQEKSGVNLKKIIIIGLIIFAISVGIVVFMNIINEDNTLSSNLVESSILEKDFIKKSNPSLFREINNEEDKPKEIKTITSKLIEQLAVKNKETKKASQTSEKKDILTKNNNEIKPNTPPQDFRNIAENPNQIKKSIDKSIFQSSNNDIVKRGFYVQVGAFYKNLPDKPFLNKLKSNNYFHKLYKLRLNNRDVTKVLIGPYENKEDALRALLNIRNKIAKDAFVLKMN